MLTCIPQGKPYFLGYRELLGRQQPVQECRLGEVRLRKQAQQEEMSIPFAQLVSREGVRRQIINSAHDRELGPVPKTSNHSWGLTVQPLTGNANRAPLRVPQPSSNNRTHTHHNPLNTDPVPCEEYPSPPPGGTSLSPGPRGGTYGRADRPCCRWASP